jgi:hypothetical protein
LRPAVDVPTWDGPVDEVGGESETA